MGDTSKQGMISQTAILNRLVQLGHEVLLPWHQDLGYDLAYYVETEERHFGFFVHKESQLVRIQCKTARLSKDGAYLIFNTSTVSMGGAGVWKKKKSGYRGRADWFGVYSPDTGKVYMISVWDAPDAGQMILRLKPTKNNQEQGVKWAKDYLRHEAAWVAVETEYSVLNLVFCHQSPTKTCVRSDPEVGQLLGQCTSPGRDQPIHEETLELQASRRLEG